MGLSRIVWNTNTLDFPEVLSDFVQERKRLSSITMSDGRVNAVALRASFYEGRVLLDRFTSQAFVARLNSWWSWASQGKQYSFALDSAKVFDAPSTGSSGVGSTSISVASTTGLTVLDWIRLINANGIEEDVVQVSSLSSTLISYLGTGFVNYFDHPAGTTVRHVGYFPKVIAIDQQQPIKENITSWTLDHLFREDAA